MTGRAEGGTAQYQASRANKAICNSSDGFESMIKLSCYLCCKSVEITLSRPLRISEMVHRVTLRSNE